VAWLGTKQQQAVAQPPATIGLAAMDLRQHAALQLAGGFGQAGLGDLGAGAFGTEQFVERLDQVFPVDTRGGGGHVVSPSRQCRS